jgi:hypothetical protein
LKFKNKIREKQILSQIDDFDGRSVVHRSTFTMRTAAAAVGDMHTDANPEDIPNDDDGQVAAWAACQLASPVHLQSLRVVYDALVDRLDPHHPHHPQAHDPHPQQRLLNSLRLTCRLLLEIHQACASGPNMSTTGTATASTGQPQQPQPLLTASQQHSIETTEERCRWLLDHHDHPHDHDTNILPVVPLLRSDLSGDCVITNLCRHQCHHNPDTIHMDIHPAAATRNSNSTAFFKSVGHTEWTYDDGYVLAKNDNDQDNDHEQEESDDDGGSSNILPSRAELAAEEAMLWRMAETPIPSSP